MQEVKEELEIFSVAKDIADVFGKTKITEMRIDLIGNILDFALECSCQFRVKFRHENGSPKPLENQSNNGFVANFTTKIWSLTLESPHKRQHLETKGLTDYGKVIRCLESWKCEK